jgi:hypothetical protein
MTAHCPNCGCVLEKPRSRNQHNRFFALATAAFNHWPESHNFRPKSVDHLRYWLTVEAGRFDVVRNIRVHSVDAIALQALLEGVLRTSDDERLFIDIDGDLVCVRKAHSIKTTGADAMPQREFSILCDEIDSVLRAEGFDPDQLLKETASAA